MNGFGEVVAAMDSNCIARSARVAKGLMAGGPDEELPLGEKLLGASMAPASRARPIFIRFGVFLNRRAFWCNATERSNH